LVVAVKKHPLAVVLGDQDVGASVPILAGTNTTIGVIATDAKLSKTQAQRLTQIGHNGLDRSIHPVHTLSDRDTLYALSTGLATATAGMSVLCVMAAGTVALATVPAVKAVQGLQVGAMWLPGVGDLE